jgi:3-oxoacyl-[acyl-carrier protein] reductase
MMDLGIAGRTAVVCASSRGLGKACAVELAKAGCTLVVNGRDKAALEETAREITTGTGAKVIAVVADVGTEEGQAKILGAVPQIDILVNNNGGPPFRDFREVDREAQLKGLINNMVSPIEMIQAVIDPMVERRFGRIVYITSGSV